MNTPQSEYEKAFARARETHPLMENDDTVEGSNRHYFDSGIVHADSRNAEEKIVLLDEMLGLRERIAELEKVPEIEWDDDCGWHGRVNGFRGVHFAAWFMGDTWDLVTTYAGIIETKHGFPSLALAQAEAVRQVTALRNTLNGVK